MSTLTAVRAPAKTGGLTQAEYALLMASLRQLRGELDSLTRRVEAVETKVYGRTVEARA